MKSFGRVEREHLSHSLLPGSLFVGTALALLLTLIDEPLTFLLAFTGTVCCGLFIAVLIRSPLTVIPPAVILFAVHLGRFGIPLGAKTLLVGPFELLLGIASISVAIRVLLGGGHAIRVLWLDVAVILFFTAHLPQCFLAADKVRYAAGLWVLGAGIAFYAVVRLHLLDESRLLTFFRLIPLWTGFLGLLVLYSAVTHPSGFLFAIKHKAVEVPWGRSNYLASFLVLGAPLAYAALSAARKAIEKLLFFTAFCLCVLGTVLTGSRGGMIALGIVILLEMTLWIRDSRMVWAIALVLTTGMILVMAMPVLEIQHSGFVNLWTKASGRYEIWRSGLELFLARPMLGYGILGFYYTADLSRIGVMRAHNFFLEALLSAGIPGGAALLWLLFRTGRTLRRILRSSADRTESIMIQGLCLALTGALLHGLVEINLYGIEFDVMFFGVLGTLACMEQLRHDRHSHLQ